MDDFLLLLGIAMVAIRKQSSWARRLREIEREKERVREQMDKVHRWAESIPESDRQIKEPKFRGTAMPDCPYDEDPIRPFGAVYSTVEVVERQAEEAPVHESSLDFEPGPEGLDTKRVVMPRLQRTDLLRPGTGHASSHPRLMAPEHERFRSYFGTAGLKRVRQARRERGSQRLRTFFMILMVLTLGFILLKMVT